MFLFLPIVLFSTKFQVLKDVTLAMGVQGLLPIFKRVMDPVHVSKYAGKTVGVDASGWLYKGAYSCPIDLVLDRPTDACGTN